MHHPWIVGMCHTTAVLSKKPSCLSGASLQIPRAISSILHSDEMRWISDTHRVWKVTSANCIICSQGPLQNRQTGGHSWCFLWLHAGDWSKNQEKKIARRFLWVIRWPAVPLRICAHRSSFSYASRCPERHVQFESQHVPSGGIHQNTSKMDNTYPPAKLTSKCIYVNVYIYTHQWISHIVQLYHTYIYIYIIITVIISYTSKIHLPNIPTPAVTTFRYRRGSMTHRQKNTWCHGAVAEPMDAMNEKAWQLLAQLSGHPFKASLWLWNYLLMDWWPFSSEG